MSANGPQVPAGWYPDPTNPNNQRYWDGGQWTEHVHAMVDAPTQPAATTPMAQPGPQAFGPQPTQPMPQQYAGPGGPNLGPAYQDGTGAPHYAPVPPKQGMSTASKVLIVLLIAFLVLVGGCTVALVALRGTASETFESGGPILDGIVDEATEDDAGAITESDGPIPPVDTPSTGAGSRQDAFPYDQPVDITWETFGDAEGSVWSTTIGPPRDITADVLAENPFNEGPPEGVTFVGFDVELILLQAGKEPLSPGFNFSWEILGGSTAAAYDVFTIETESFGCGVAPDSFDDFAEVFLSGSISGTVCIPLPTEDLGHPETQIALHFVDDSRVVFGE